MFKVNGARWVWASRSACVICLIDKRTPWGQRWIWYRSALVKLQWEEKSEYLKSARNQIILSVVPSTRFPLFRQQPLSLWSHFSGSDFKIALQRERKMKRGLHTFSSTLLFVHQDYGKSSKTIRGKTNKQEENWLQANIEHPLDMNLLQLPVSGCGTSFIKEWVYLASGEESLALIRYLVSLYSAWEELHVSESDL